MLGKTHSPALLLLCVLVPPAFAAQANDASPPKAPRTRRAPHRPSPLLNSSEGLTVISAALESRRPAHSKARLLASRAHHLSACGLSLFLRQLVRSLPWRSGISPRRARPARRLGRLARTCRHRGQPLARHLFSSLRSGLGVDSYSASYWKQRGQPSLLSLRQGPFNCAVRKTREPRSPPLPPNDNPRSIALPIRRAAIAASQPACAGSLPTTAPGPRPPPAPPTGP